MSYKIKSIFGPTLQGEGTHSGTPVIFIRFSGCNRWNGLEESKPKAICSFCDTDFRGGEKVKATEILAMVQTLSEKVKTIVISGGEATLQLDQELVGLLVNNGYKIHLETNGSKDIAEYTDLLEHITMSPKQDLVSTNLQFADDLKILYPPISNEITPEKFADYPAKAKYLQPVHNENYEENLKSTIKYCLENPEWKLSLQTHKIIGVE